jgi:hypothetical protein
MKNLARKNPEKQLADAECAYIRRDHPLFERLCRSFPWPAYIFGDRKSLVSFGLTEEQIADIYGRQEQIKGEIRAQLHQMDEDVRTELRSANIDVENNATRATGEVPTIFSGKLGIYTFSRAWTYWVVSGQVPVQLAREIYADPVGQKDIRTNGCAGNMNPSDCSSVTSYHIDSIEGLQRFVDMVS